MSNSLRPHGLQHARLLCPSLSQSLLKFMSIESVMLFNHLILCCPLLLLPSVFPSIRVFSNAVLVVAFNAVSLAQCRQLFLSFIAKAILLPWLTSKGWRVNWWLIILRLGWAEAMWAAVIYFLFHKTGFTQTGCAPLVLSKMMWNGIVIDLVNKLQCNW